MTPGKSRCPRKTLMSHATRESFFDELKQTLASRANVFDGGRLRYCVARGEALPRRPARHR